MKNKNTLIVSITLFVPMMLFAQTGGLGQIAEYLSQATVPHAKKYFEGACYIVGFLWLLRASKHYMINKKNPLHPINFAIEYGLFGLLFLLIPIISHFILGLL